MHCEKECCLQKNMVTMRCVIKIAKLHIVDVVEFVVNCDKLKFIIRKCLGFM